jgi:hypothetical protein
VYSAAEIQEKAMPLLARLDPGGKEVSVLRGMSGRADGSTQRLWCVVSRESPADALRNADDGPVPAKDLTGWAELHYDADTGALVYASSTPDPGAQTNLSPSGLTEAEAVRVARGWMPKLGFCPEGETMSPAVFPPRKMPRGLWRVWLRGQETPQGPPLTVEVVVRSAGDELIRATVVERISYPGSHLPRRPSGHPS